MVRTPHMTQSVKPAECGEFLRDANDHHKTVFLLGRDSLEKPRQFIQSTNRRTTTEKAGVISNPKGENMEHDALDRREFIANAGKCMILAGLMAPIAGSAAIEIKGAKPAPMPPFSLDLEKPEYHVLKQVGGSMKIPNPLDKKKPIIVVRSSETRVAAFSSKCTHWGCEVPLPAGNVIKCHCHGSVFDADGKVVHGPAKKNLAAFKATLNGSILTIEPDGVEPVSG
jgi:Rieske Fe-S protein